MLLLEECHDQMLLGNTKINKMLPEHRLESCRCLGMETCNREVLTKLLFGSLEIEVVFFHNCWPGIAQLSDFMLCCMELPDYVFTKGTTPMLFRFLRNFI